MTERPALIEGGTDTDRRTVKEFKQMAGEQTYHRSGSYVRSGVGDQVSQGVLLPRSVDYVSIVCHHDRHLLHHF